MDSQRSSRRGFAGMDHAKQREIASKGGQAAHKKGTAHEFTSDEARAAGRKGGEAVSTNRAHMSAIGRKGGESSHTGHKAQDKMMTDSQREDSASQNGEQSLNGEQSSHATGGRDANAESRTSDDSFADNSNGGAGDDQKIHAGHSNSQRE
jgi:uncharacterized protein